MLLITEGMAANRIYRKMKEEGRADLWKTLGWTLPLVSKLLLLTV